MQASEELTSTSFYFDRDMAGAELFRAGGGVVAVYSARCPGKEGANEDSAGLVPVGDAAVVLVVADGAGGMPCGEEASRIAVRCVADALVGGKGGEGDKGGDGDIRSAILDGIERANVAIQALGVGAATTMAVVEICDGVMRSYHAGDSTVMVVGNRGKVKRQTVSHSPVGFAVESGMLDESEAMAHEDRHIVSNVLGNAGMRIEVGAPLRLAARDTLLVATDGVDDNFNTDEIVERIRKGPIDRAAGVLAGDARDRMGGRADGGASKPDDVTFVLFRVGS